MKISLPLIQIKQAHKIECPDVSLGFFMEHYCKNLLVKEKYTTVEVVVSPSFSFVFDK